ncbi:signal transduction histidine kinase [Pelomonas saccharophila]|uniref:histidine kinase n=1 Tax=Roseateles saccharophilus TaxID=304 RepID=A0ABU1YJ75_ROSSA|nr:CHASE3 domain-containing protein [Roseateles saccharophilus]MDR7268906.1 signal transduction histidine kinase [Roseateles saccharophilus]
MSLLVAAFLAFVGTAVGASHSLAELLERDAERSQALRTQTELQRLLMLLIDIETGQRGFIITGQQPFLRPYEDALGELADVRTGLRERLPRQSADTTMLGRLDALIDERLAQTRQTIARRLADGGAAMHDLSAYVDGKRVMDELRFQIEQLTREQQRRVAMADEATQTVRQRTTRLTRLLPAGGLATLAVAVALMLRERRLRDRAEAALRDANAGLEQQVAQRTEALSHALARIRSFAVEMDRSIEAERRRLAREVHDQVGQVGTAIKMLTLSLRARLAPRSEPLVDELQEMAEEAIRSARHISAELRPPLLDELGLEAALGHYLQALGRQSGLTTELDLSDDALLPPEQASPLFRIVQEACTNVLRHAQARKLRVAGRGLAVGARPGYELEVIDDGRGPGSTRPDASGLRNMRERAELAGGSFDFGPAPGAGTCVRVWLPLESPLPAPAASKQEEAWL